MIINEKTKLLPKDNQKPYVIAIPTQEDFNNNSSLLETYNSYALTREELKEYIDDPFWIRVRCICFSLYWLLCIVALLTSCFLAGRALDSGLCKIAFDANGTGMLDNITSIVAPGTPLDPSQAAADSSAGVVLRMLSDSSS